MAGKSVSDKKYLFDIDSDGKEDENNSTNAVIRNTGIFLKESGGTGTISHVDIAV